MTKIRLALAGLCCVGLLSAQSLDLSGIVNVYGAVVNIDTAGCAPTLTLADAGGFQAGMGLIIIQMQGAAIDQSNTTNFGNIDRLNGAGWYEYNRVVNVAGNTITLENQPLRNYTVAGRVQCIGFRHPAVARVVDTVWAKAWDGATGGVVVVEATDTIYLRAPVSADGRGFRGATSVVATDIDCTVLTRNDAFSYPADNWRGAPKGEGVARPISGNENGRGAQANGGGGGNNHNSGGGGGGHLTRGGAGGQNREPSFGGCDGFFPGEGGKAIPFDSGRLFMGGGGGAGHRNNETRADGGAGGGIVILCAPVIVFAGGGASANGRDGLSTFGDGSGGGGAGGSLAVISQMIVGQPQLSVRGGTGGSVDNGNARRCMGPGGGGSGGVLAQVIGLTVDLSGGAAGLTTRSTNCEEGNNGAAAGEAGRIFTISGLAQGRPRGQVPMISTEAVDGDICEGREHRFTVGISGAGATFQWQSDTGGGFQALTEDSLHSGVATNSLLISGAAPGEAGYRLLISSSDGCFTPLLAGPYRLTVRPLPTVDFTYTTDGLSVSFQATADNALQYRWDFGDGQEGDGAQADHDYAAGGNYTVRLTVSNDCGEVTITEEISLAGAPIASWRAEPTEACEGETIAFFDESVGENVKRQWFFPGGEPATSNEAQPRVTYLQAGDYDVVLIVGNEAGSDTLARADYVRISAAPPSGFTVTVQDMTADFSAIPGADQYLWDFGDGNGAEGLNPQHTYQRAGRYLVTLTAINRCDSTVSTREIVVGGPPEAGLTMDQRIGCAPLTVRFSDQSVGTVEQYNWTFTGGSPATSSEANPVVRFPTPGRFPIRLETVNSLGSSTAFDTVEVLSLPELTFTVEQQVLTVTLTAEPGADSYQWELGDGTTAEGRTVTYSYGELGTYTITLTYTHPCGNGQVQRNVTVGSAPLAVIGSDRTGGCAPTAIRFRDQSVGLVDQRSWSFSGGDPATSSEAEPVVRYTTPGQHVVELSVSNELGTSTVYDTVEIALPPEPAFDVAIDGLTVELTNRTLNADQYRWQFGDGESSRETSPVYTYRQPGIYSITLNAENEFCGIAVSKTVALGLTSADELSILGIDLFPNPSSDVLTIRGFTGGQFRLFGPYGQLLSTHAIRMQNELIDLSTLPAGLYYGQLLRDGRGWIVKLIKQ